MSREKSSPPNDLAQHPDAWQRFERAVDVVAKSPPQHRVGGNKSHTKAVKAGKKASSKKMRLK